MGDDKKKKYKSDDITKKVTDAIAKGDFSKLNDMVKDTVKDTVEDVVEEIRTISRRSITRYSSSGKHTRNGAFSPNERYTGYKKDRDDSYRDGDSGYTREKYPSYNNREEYSYGDRRQDNRAYNQRNYPIYDGINTKLQYYHQNNQHNSHNQNYPYNQNNRYNMARHAPFPAKVRFVPRKYSVSILISVVSWFFLVTMLLALFGGGFDISSLMSSMLVCGLSAVGVIYSHQNLYYLSRARRLFQFIRDRDYITIEEVANILLCQQGKARRIMIEILNRGILPEARFDTSGTTVLLTKDAYQEYRSIEKQRQEYLTEHKQNRIEQVEEEVEVDVAKDLTDEQRKDWLNVVNQGETYIKKLRDLNDEIPDEVISVRLDELERLLQEIFNRVKRKPSEANQMRRFMDYYLPTTVKLVEKYKEFGKVYAPGKEIQDAKSNVENTISTINQAFVEMLNNLYKNDIYDVTTDASVIKTMLAKEGLVNDFK